MQGKEYLRFCICIHKVALNRFYVIRWPMILFRLYFSFLVIYWPVV